MLRKDIVLYRMVLGNPLMFKFLSLVMKKVSKLVIAIAIVAVIISVSVYTTYIYSYNSGYSNAINNVSDTQVLQAGSVLYLNPGGVDSFDGYYNHIPDWHNFSVTITGFVHISNGSNKIEINFMNSLGDVIKSTGWLNTSKIVLSFDVHNLNLWSTGIWIVANSNNSAPLYAQFTTLPLTVMIKDIK